MRRRKVKLGGHLSGVVIAWCGKVDWTPPASDDVLSFARPAAAEPIAPAPPVPDPAEVVALRNMLADLGRVTEKLRTHDRAKVADMAQTTVELGVAVAERLVFAAIAADRQRLDRVVRDALERMQPASTITVRGHADDLALLQRQLTDYAELKAAQDTLTLRPEKGCERGQVKIEAGECFAEWDTQRSLTELRERLLEETFANE